MHRILHTPLLGPYNPIAARWAEMFTYCRSGASEASEGTTPNNETIQPTFFTTFLGAEFAQNLDARRQFCVF